MNKRTPEKKGEDDALFVISFAGAVLGIFVAIIVLGILEMVDIISITFKTFYP